MTNKRMMTEKLWRWIAQDIADHGLPEVSEPVLANGGLDVGGACFSNTKKREHSARELAFGRALAPPLIRLVSCEKASNAGLQMKPRVTPGRRSIDPAALGL